MSTFGWIVLIVVVLIVIGIAAAVGRNRQRLVHEQHGRKNAADLREQGKEAALDARQREAEAAGQQAEAEKMRIEAERLQQNAQQTHGEANDIRGQAGEHIRNADDGDSDVAAGAPVADSDNPRSDDIR